MNKEQNQTKIEQLGLRRKMKGMYVITSILFIALVIMSILFYIQWHSTKKLVAFLVDLIEAELIREAPEEVDRQEIKNTFERIRKAVPSFGKVDLKKAIAAANYAQKARSDEQWTAKEVNTLLHLINASLKIDKEK